MPPDSVMILLSRLSHSDSSRSTFSRCAGSGGLPNRPRLKRTVAHTRLERVGRQLLRHQADLAARGAVVAHDVVAVGEHRAGAGVDDAADDADQRGLAGAVGPEQREDLAAADVEVDVLERLEARGVGLADVADRDDGGGVARRHAESSFVSALRRHLDDDLALRVSLRDMGDGLGRRLQRVASLDHRCQRT